MHINEKGVFSLNTGEDSRGKILSIMKFSNNLQKSKNFCNDNFCLPLLEVINSISLLYLIEISDPTALSTKNSCKEINDAYHIMKMFDSEY